MLHSLYSSISSGLVGKCDGPTDRPTDGPTEKVLLKDGLLCQMRFPESITCP